ncbi:MAG: hypothetical protein ACYCST_04945 [Acidimicrobiales bacterium]
MQPSPLAPVAFRLVVETTGLGTDRDRKAGTAPLGDLVLQPLRFEACGLERPQGRRREHAKRTPAVSDDRQDNSSLIEA